MSIPAIVSTPQQASARPQMRSLQPIQRSEWKYCAAAMLILSAAYLLTVNAFWHPGPDTAFYISVSRSLALHGEFTFNGLPVGKIPPLWPLLLAGAMKLSTSFAFLNLIPGAFLVGASGFWYWILRRVASPFKAFTTVVLSGMLFYWYTAAADLRSEGIFCFLLAAAILLAMQVAEGRQQVWRIALAATLCALMVSTRWAGLTAFLPVAAAMIRGQLKPKYNRQWIGLTAVTLATIIAFMVLRIALAHVPGMHARAANATPDAGSFEDPESGSLPMQAVIDHKGLSNLGARVAASGKWISSLLWMPMYLGVTSGLAAIFTNTVGWILIALFALCLYAEARARQWIWVGVLLYCVALVTRWNGVNPRYLVPIAPLCFLGAWLGLDYLAALFPRCRRFYNLAAALFVISIALCNSALWAVDVYIARSNRFYDRYLAGETQPLFAVAQYLDGRGLKDGELSVSPYYVNLGRQRPNGQGWRSMHLLTGRSIRVISKKVCTDEPNKKLLEWASTRGIKYYLYRPPVSPWRAHHFRIGWLQRLLTRAKNIPENPSWILYELEGKHAVPIQLPKIQRYPNRVPGM